MPTNKDLAEALATLREEFHQYRRTAEREISDLRNRVDQANVEKRDMQEVLHSAPDVKEVDGLRSTIEDLEGELAEAKRGQVPMRHRLVIEGEDVYVRAPLWQAGPDYGITMMLPDPSGVRVDGVMFNLKLEVEGDGLSMLGSLDMEEFVTHRGPLRITIDHDLKPTEDELEKILDRNHAKNEGRVVSKERPTDV